jgi:hypothetical protein
MWKKFLLLKNLPKVNYLPIGENSPNMFTLQQGDKVGLIFAQWVIAYFTYVCSLLKITEIVHISGLLISDVRVLH